MPAAVDRLHGIPEAYVLPLIPFVRPRAAIKEAAGLALKRGDLRRPRPSEFPDRDRRTGFAVDIIYGPAVEPRKSARRRDGDAPD